MARKTALASASLVRNQFDNLAKISRCSGGIFIAHGDRDRLIPMSQGQKLLQAAPQPKEFFLLKGCDHNDPYPPDFYSDLAELAGTVGRPRQNQNAAHHN